MKPSGLLVGPLSQIQKQGVRNDKRGQPRVYASVH